MHWRVQEGGEYKETPLKGVLLCSNSAEHEKISTKVSSCAQRMQDGTKHEKTLFMNVSSCSKSVSQHQARKDIHKECGNPSWVIVYYWY